MIKRSSLPPARRPARWGPPSSAQASTGGSSPRPRAPELGAAWRQAARPIEPVTRRHSAHDRRRPDDDPRNQWAHRSEPRERVGVGELRTEALWVAIGHRVAATLRWHADYPLAAAPQWRIPLSSGTRTHITVLLVGSTSTSPLHPRPLRATRDATAGRSGGAYHYSWSHASHRVAVGDKHLEELLEAASDRAVEEGATLFGWHAHALLPQ